MFLHLRGGTRTVPGDGCRSRRERTRLPLLDRGAFMAQCSILHFGALEGEERQVRLRVLAFSDAP